MLGAKNDRVFIFEIWCTLGPNERQDPTWKENIVTRRMQIWHPRVSISCYINFMKVMKIIVSRFFSRSWVLWRRRPGTERNHRVARFPPRLPQLCQLHVADNHRREEPDPAHLCHAGTGRRLWYRVGLRWSAIAGQLKNEVRSKFSRFYLIFPPALFL